MLLNPAKPHDYRILCALRGPDSKEPGHYDAKLFLTSVLRHFVGCPTNAGAIVTGPTRAIYDWAGRDDEQKQEIHNFLFANNHFATHAGWGFSSLLSKLRSQKKSTKALRAYIDFLMREGLVSLYLG